MRYFWSTNNSCILTNFAKGSSWSEEIGNTAKRKSVDNENPALLSPVKPVKDQNDLHSATESQSRKRSSSLQQHSDTDEKTEEFRDSTAFLKGTQSLNPHNDYSQNFVDTGQRPQNFIRKFYYFLPQYGNRGSEHVKRI